MGAIKGFFRSVGTTLRLMTYNKAGFIGFLATCLVLIICLLGPFIVPLDNNDQAGSNLPTAIGTTLAGHRSPRARHLLA